MIAQANNRLTMSEKTAIQHKTEKLLIKAFGEILLLVICVIPGMIFSYKTLQEPWNMFRLARAHLFLHNPDLATFATAGASYRGEHVGVELIHTILITLTDWPLESIALVPIGSLLLAVVYYGIARSTARSPWSAAAVTIYLTWYYPTLYSQFSTQTYVWAHVLFLSFLILLRSWIHKRTYVLSGFMIVIFIATFFQYHTTPLWITAAIITAVVALKLKSKQKLMSPAIVSWALPLFCIVFYFSFDTVVYGNGLARLKAEAINETFLQNFLYKIVAPLMPHTSATIPMAFETVQSNARSAVWSTLLILIILTVPFGIWCLVKLYRLFISRKITCLFQTNDDIFIWAIIITAVAHMILYSFYGAVSLRVIPLAFPLILPLIVRGLRQAVKFEIILTSALAILAVIGFISFALYLQPDPLASQIGSAQKLIKHNDRLLADANVYGAFLLKSAQEDKIVDFVWLNQETYAAAIGQKPIEVNNFEYLAVDMSDKPIISANWRFLEPWTKYLPAIEYNRSLNKVYDSKYLKLFQPASKQLSNYQLSTQDFSVPNRSLLLDTLRLFLAMIVLAFIPGAVLIMLRRKALHMVDKKSTIIGLAVGLSIAFATITSYIADFTPVGLAHIVPLSVLIIVDVLGIYLFIRFSQIHINRDWVIAVITLVFAIFLWSYISTEIAHARNQQYSDFTELFVTQPDSQSDLLTVNIVNRSEQPGNFSLIFTLDGIEVQKSGPQYVAPNSLWIENWSMPSSRVNDRLIITLEKDGVPTQELWLSGMDTQQSNVLSGGFD